MLEAKDAEIAELKKDIEESYADIDSHNKTIAYEIEQVATLMEENTTLKAECADLSNQVVIWRKTVECSEREIDRLNALLEQAREALEYQKRHQNGDASCDLQTFIHMRDAAINAALGNKPTSKGCGEPLAKGQWWSTCGETDMGQSIPVLCTKCGGEYKLQAATGKGEW